MRNRIFVKSDYTGVACVQAPPNKSSCISFASLLANLVNFTICLLSVILFTGISAAKAMTLHLTHAVSSVFTADTRDVGPLSGGVSGNFLVDNRALDGVTGFAVSGTSSIDTGGHLMGVPIVRGISPEIVPGLDVRQWITISGTGFAEGARVILRTGNEVFTIPTDRTQWVSDTEIRVFVNVTSEPAEWTVQVKNPDSTTSAMTGFFVGGAAVTPTHPVDFGTLTVGDTSTRTFILRNTGQQTINWSAALGGMFALDASASGTLNAGETTQLTINYAPTAPGPHAVTARFNLGGQIHQRNLTGRAEVGELAASNTLSGRVVIVNNAGIQVPVPNSLVWLTPGNINNNGATRKMFSDHNGYFEFDKLTSGPHVVSAYTTLGTLSDYMDTNVSVNIGVTPNPITVILDEKPPYVPPVREIEPVVLVRGLGEEGGNEGLYWATMYYHLASVENFEVWDPNMNDNVVLFGEQNYNYNAGTLESYLLAEVVRQKNQNNTHVRAIHLVAHSMGGLTCRRLISNQLQKKPGDPKLPPIKTLITLSTPHAGSPLGTTGAVVSWYTGGWDWKPNWESTKSCATSVVRNQVFDWPNNSHTSPIRLAVAGGNTPGNESRSYKAADQWLFNNRNPAEERINDGAVSLPSSLGYYHQIVGVRDWEKIYTFPQARSGSGWLISDPSQADLDHSEIKSSPAIRSWVANILKNRPATQQSEPVFASAPIPMDFEKPFSGHPVDEWLGTLQPNAVKTFQTPLSGHGTARWMVSLSDNGATVRLRVAGGTWISEGGPSVDWEIVDEGARRLLMITLHEPQPGLWEIELDSTELAAASEVAVAVMEEGGPAFEAIAANLVATGEAVPLRATAVWDDGLGTTAVTGGTVEATVIVPDGTEAIRTLPDDGLNGDEATDDGIHGLLADEFPEPGNYEVLLRYSGSHPNGGEAFRRLARASFTRSAPGGFITEILGYHMEDADGNGYPEAIIFDIRVDVTEPGDFSLSGTLVEADGSASFQAVTEFHREEAGAGVVNLVFDQRGLPMGRESGPFVFSQLRLVRAEGAREWLHDYPATDYTVSTRMFNGYSRHLRVSGDFNMGWVKVGQSATRTLRIHNDGWQTMVIGGLELPDWFAGNFEGEIPPGAFQEVEVTFTPPSVGSFGSGFEVFSDANAGSVEAAWSGIGYDGILLDDWLADEGVAEGDRGPLDDPNGDGVPNLLSYLFNLPPGVGGHAAAREHAMPQPQLGEDEGGRYLALRYRHNRNAERLSVVLEACESLEAEDWQTITPDQVLDVGVDPETGDPIREMRVRVGEQPRKFIRLVVRELGSP